MSNQISAKVICDSINEHNHRITTIEAVIPRIVLAELNTHRMFSRNSASSRAIPARKMIQMVKDDPFIPIKWMKEHKGMQGTEYFDLTQPEVVGQFRPKYFPEAWLRAKDTAVNMAESISDAGLTKQLTNRLIEPFMWHKVLITATDYENFISLRADNNAEIHIADFAYKLLDSLNNSIPKPLKAGQWHIPYGEDINWDALYNIVSDNGNISFMIEPFEKILELKIKVATARCAQTSYIVIGEDDKPMDYVKLIGLHDRLATNGHVSPFEHCARAMDGTDYELNCKYIPQTKSYEYGWLGNFKGWIQYRKMLPNENRTDLRLIKHTYNG